MAVTMALALVLASTVATSATAAATTPSPTTTGTSTTDDATTGATTGTEGSPTVEPWVVAPQYFSSPPLVPGQRYRHNFPDPFVLRVGGTYFAYASSTGGQYLPVLTSTDLFSWYPAGNGEAMPTPPSWALANPIRGEQWAPAVVALGGQYVAYSSWEVAPDRRCISAASGPTPTGPFTDRGTPLRCDADPAGSIDPEPFIDGDGRPYLLWKSEGERNRTPTRLWSRPLTASGLAFTNEPRSLLLTTALSWEEPIIENPSMLFRSGAYHLVYSAGDWASPNYATGVARCDSPRGPCVRSRTTPLITNDATQWGPAGGSLFIDTLGRLRLAYHAWNPPYSSYPSNPSCDAYLLCASQGYRGLRIAHLANQGPTLAPVPSTPTGNVDLATSVGPRQARVAGWTLDPETPDPVSVHVYVNGAYRGSAVAELRRADVGRAYPGYGNMHGFDRTVTGLRPGPNQVCVYAINVLWGTVNPLLSCRNVVAPTGNPFGNVEVVRTTGARQAQVAGWVLDPDTANPVSVHVYVNGAYRTSAVARLRRPDVGRAYPGYGNLHGFDLTVSRLRSGSNQVCVYAINLGRGTTNPLLTCSQVQG